jgi:D-alanyl-D-alanine carboxypeptidase
MLLLTHTYRLAAVLVLLAGSMLLAATVQAGPYSALVVDTDSGRVLFEQNADQPRYPASLTKMMTLYIVFDMLEQGRLSLRQRLRVSLAAATRPPTKLGLRVGDTLTVEEAILGLVTESANDAATVLAEALGGTEAGFAWQMTAKAHELGMTQTYFHNASGLPDPFQATTAWDMFKLAMALQKHFPQYYPYFSRTYFYFRNRICHNHNHLLESYPGADGIKTGYIRNSGFNLVASAQRNGHRLIGVVFGGETAAARDALMRDILDQGFAQLEAGGPLLQTAYRSYPPAMTSGSPSPGPVNEASGWSPYYPVARVTATSAIPLSNSPKPAVSPEPAGDGDQSDSAYSFTRNTAEPPVVSHTAEPVVVKPAPTDPEAVGDRFNGAYAVSRTPSSINPIPQRDGSEPAPLPGRAVATTPVVNGYIPGNRFNGAYPVARTPSSMESAPGRDESEPAPLPTRAMPTTRVANGSKAPVLLAQAMPPPKAPEEDSAEAPALPPPAAPALPPRSIPAARATPEGSAEPPTLIGKPMYDEVTTESSVDQPNLLPKSAPAARKPVPADSNNEEPDTDQPAAAPKSTSTDRQSPATADKANPHGKAEQPAAASQSISADRKSSRADKETQGGKAESLAAAKSTAKSKPLDKAASAQPRSTMALAAPKSGMPAAASKSGTMHGSSLALPTSTPAKPVSCQVQVGAFSNKADAAQQLVQASQAVPQSLSRTRAAVTPVVQGSKTLYRACFKGLSQMEARTACQSLKRKQIACFVVPQGG